MNKVGTLLFFIALVNIQAACMCVVNGEVLPTVYCFLSVLWVIVLPSWRQDLLPQATYYQTLKYSVKKAMEEEESTLPWPCGWLPNYTHGSRAAGDSETNQEVHTHAFLFCAWQKTISELTPECLSRVRIQALHSKVTGNCCICKDSDFSFTPILFPFAHDLLPLWSSTQAQPGIHQVGVGGVHVPSPQPGPLGGSTGVRFILPLSHIPARGSYQLFWHEHGTWGRMERGFSVSIDLESGTYTLNMKGFTWWEWISAGLGKLFDSGMRDNQVLWLILAKQTVTSSDSSFLPRLLSLRDWAPPENGLKAKVENQ